MNTESKKAGWNTQKIISHIFHFSALLCWREFFFRSISEMLNWGWPITVCDRNLLLVRVVFRNLRRHIWCSAVNRLIAKAVAERQKNYSATKQNAAFEYKRDDLAFGARRRSLDQTKNWPGDSDRQTSTHPPADMELHSAPQYLRRRHCLCANNRCRSLARPPFDFPLALADFGQPPNDKSKNYDEAPLKF